MEAEYVFLTFGLRCSSTVKTVELYSSWDNYTRPIRLGKRNAYDVEWGLALKISSSLLEAGQIYWYYYVTDRKNYAYNPDEGFSTEPITKQTMNIYRAPFASPTINSLESIPGTITSAESRSGDFQEALSTEGDSCCSTRSSFQSNYSSAEGGSFDNNNSEDSSSKDGPIQNDSGVKSTFGNYSRSSDEETQFDGGHSYFSDESSSEEDYNHSEDGSSSGGGSHSHRQGIIFSNDFSVL